MTDVSRKDLLGVVFIDEKIKLIEVNSTKGNQFRINKITEDKLDFPFDAKSIKDKKYIPEHADNLRRLIDKYQFVDQRAAFSLGSEFVIKEVT